ncbi:MAG TPA: DUF2252 domain-containing protein, partial [Acidobacteriaceae bacterium]
LPRAGHAAWNPNQRRHDPLQLLAESAKGRLPELVKLKYRLMAASPFGYFRGAVPVMAADLSLLPHSNIVTQICGDAHVRNLGAFEAADGRLVFDINDFDESLPAPFEWDVKRLAASLVLAGRESNSKESACQDAVYEFSSAYAGLIHCLSELPVLDVARFQVKRLRRTGVVSAVLAKAERSTPLRSLLSLTRPAVVGDSPLQGVPAHADLRVFKDIPNCLEGAPPTLARVPAEEAQAVLAAMTGYRRTLLPERQHFLDQYRPVDVGFKIVGTGSVGLRDYVVYLEGNGPQDPLFLQIKEEAPSGWAPYAETIAGAGHHPAHDGQRVADGQRAMQFQSDPFLGWTSIDDRPFLVRQLNDHKASIQVDDLRGRGLAEYARICGELLARGHARSGDAVVLRGYVGKGRSLGEALGGFAARYADQTDRDWKALVRSGLAGEAKPAKGKATRKPAAKRKR